MQYNYEWDPVKAKQNQKKHQVSFQRAAEIFRDPLSISIPDDEHSLTEERWITMGEDSRKAILVVVHTFQAIDEKSSNIRIISARKATRKEMKHYRRDRS
ncbi:MAG: BrnT family toxin [Deltaproteobacteria bacterium]|nr:BrnT family toxin [Deltaproteobacteria bacterium]